MSERELYWHRVADLGEAFDADVSSLTSDHTVNYAPGICLYKFLYVWLDFHGRDGEILRNLGWKYWFPNPLFPFIWFRVAVPQQHPELLVIEQDRNESQPQRYANHG